MSTKTLPFASVAALPIRTTPERTQLVVRGVVIVIYFIVAGGQFGLGALVGSSAPGRSILLVLGTPILWRLPIMLVTLDRHRSACRGWLLHLRETRPRAVLGLRRRLDELALQYSGYVQLRSTVRRNLSAFLRQAFKFTSLEDSHLAHWLTAVTITVP